MNFSGTFPLTPATLVRGIRFITLTSISPLEGEEDQGRGWSWEKKGPGSSIRALLWSIVQG